MRNHFILLLLFICNLGFAQVVSRPSPPKLYNNFSKEFPDFLNPSQAKQIEDKLENFSNETSNQICVVVVDDLNNLEASEYAIQLGNEWKVGQKNFNNGIVVLIKPTKEKGGRNLFIAVGYGLEGAIPDLATKRIRDEEMTPYLKQGDYFTAIDKGTDKLMSLAKGEIDVNDYAQQNSVQDIPVRYIFLIIIFFFVLLIILMRFLARGGITLSRAGTAIYWGGRGFSGGSGGSYSGGSSSSSSWGGFGGGSFGGGGSGGSW
jgi:uncharacterized protein